MTQTLSGSKNRARPETRAKSTGDGSISPVMALISGFCVVVLVIVLAVASTSDRVSKPQNINGDALGPDPWEATEQYVERADESLENMKKEDYQLKNGQPVVEDPKFWAMVTFDRLLDAQEAAQVYEKEPSLRVSTAIIGGVSTRYLPQPSKMASEEKLLQDQLELAAAYADVAIDDERLGFNGLLVYGDAAALMNVKKLPAVKAVEALPSDAARGRFGIRPVLSSGFTDKDPLFAPGLSQN